MIFLLSLAACGGGPRSGSSARDLPPVSIENAPQFAAGPLASACSTQRRPGTTRQKCGCVQAAANLTLSPSDQKKAVPFFSDPERLQSIKLSDTPENERFWYAWARFAETAERMCNG